MNDNLSILNSPSDYDRLIKELTDVYHLDFYSSSKRLKTHFPLKKDLTSSLFGLRIIFQECYEKLFTYNSNSKLIESMFLNDTLFEHLLISTFYTIRYLTENRFIKASYFLNESEPSLNFFNKSQIANNYTILMPENLENLNLNHSYTEKIHNRISSIQKSLKGRLFNIESLYFNGKRSIYIQDFLPYFSYICSDFATYSNHQAAKHDFSNFSTRTQTGKQLATKEIKRNFKIATEALFDDYRYLLEIFRDYYLNQDNPERLLFLYKLYRYFPIEALAKSIDLLEKDLRHDQLIISFCKLPNVFSRCELLSSLDPKDMTTEFLYLGNTLLPLYEKLFFALLVQLYQQNYVELQNIFSEIFEKSIFKSEDCVEFPRLYDNENHDNTQTEPIYHKNKILSLFEEQTAKRHDYELNVMTFAHIFSNLFISGIADDNLLSSNILTTSFSISELTKKAILFRRIKTRNVLTTIPTDENFDRRPSYPLGIICAKELKQIYVADYLYSAFQCNHFLNHTEFFKSTDYNLENFSAETLHFTLKQITSDDELLVLLNSLESLISLSENKKTLDKTILEILANIINKKNDNTKCDNLCEKKPLSAHTHIDNKITFTFPPEYSNEEKILMIYNACAHYIRYLCH